jgi:hypothetical protein
MNTKPTSRTGREIGAGVIALVAGVTLMVRLILRVQETGGGLDALSTMSQYFTILTNSLVFLIMVVIAKGADVPPRMLNAIIVAIAGVGIIYHTLLAHLVNLSGIDLLADHGTHTIIPLMAVIWWIGWVEKPPFIWKDPLIWVIWPALYCFYILIRASFSGFYPYPFLNVPELGVSGLVVNIGGLIVGFIAIGLILFILGRLFKTT